MATDPICGMYVDEGGNPLRRVRDNRTYYFCSQGCVEEFSNPEVQRRRAGIDLAIAWPLAVIVVGLTYAPLPHAALFAAAGLATIVQFYPGRVFYVGTFDALRSRTGNMDVLIAVATSAAYFYSVAALALPAAVPADYYFDASTVIIALILTGNYLERWTRERSSSAVRRLAEVLPSTARVLREGIERATPVAEVRIGDRLRVLPGEKVPTDGRVRTGRSTLDESLLTGESLPVTKEPGDAVLAGSLNGDGAIEIDATAVGTDTFLSQVGRLLAEAEGGRVPMQRTADRIAAVFVPTVLTLGVAAALAWFFLGGAPGQIALLIFVTVAISACPCAFGLATPAAILVGTERAAEAGVLYRGADAIERAARIDYVLTDKTGTLTSNSPALVECVAAPGIPLEEMLAIAAGLERSSEHTLARAVVRAAEARGIRLPEVAEVQTDPGSGVRGRIRGRPVAVLRGESARSEGISLTEWDDRIADSERAGSSWTVVLEDGRAVGFLAFSSPLAAGVADALSALRRAGIPTEIVSGDNEPAVRHVAEAVGIPRFTAGATPASKVGRVRQLQADGHAVAFVGDGINDAAALAAADVGIAIGTGTDVAREAGQVLLVRPDFRGVPLALEVARRTVGRVRANLWWAIGYNLVLLPIAAGALVPIWGFNVYSILPMLGAVAMGLSSTTVVLNSLSLRRIPLDGGSGTSPARARPGESAALGS
ncbi:MAG: heavy metal translocating P-type ATPase [Thermoplasmata archaeon]